MTRRAPPPWMLPLAGGLLAAGCALKAAPAARTPFLDSEVAVAEVRQPFQKAWRAAADWTRYTEVYVAPVNTDHLAAMDWWQATGRGAKLAEDMPTIAAYARGAFQAAVRDDPRGRFTLLDDPARAGPQTLLLELALVEIIPSKVTLNAIGYVPFVGLAARVVRGTTARSSVAFEARVRDGATGEVVAMFADREAEKFSPINVKDLTWYGHAHAILTEWARQFVAVAGAAPGETIRDSRGFTLTPW